MKQWIILVEGTGEELGRFDSEQQAQEFAAQHLASKAGTLTIQEVDNPGPDTPAIDGE